MKLNFLPNQYKKNKKININHSYLIEQFSDYKKIFHEIEKTIKEQITHWEKKLINLKKIFLQE